MTGASGMGEKIRRVLITGAGGFVGDRLCQYLKHETDWDICGTSRSKGRNVEIIANLTQTDDVCTLKDTFPCDTVIHTAAIARTDECEKNKEICYSTNVESTKNLISIINPEKFVLFSTYAVYNTPEGNCSESAPTHPTNVYIETKLASERIAATARNTIIFRPSVIFGYTKIDRTSKNYFMQLLDNIGKKNSMQSPTDQFFNPVHVDTVCQIVKQAIKQDIAGVYNIGSNEQISKYEFNKKIIDRFGFDGKYLVGVASSTLAVQRPNNGTISSSTIQKALGYSIPTLDSMIEQLYASTIV
jgi:dTDP-4-dehydrorhamnose reductase